MKLSSVVFSPTGTSGRIAREIARALSTSFGNGIVDEIDVTCREDVSKSFGDDELVVIAAPVYGGHMAPVAKERMKGLSASGTPCVLVAVYGNRAFENALKDMAEFASSIGFVPVAAGAFVGEHSYSTPETPIALGRPDDQDMMDTHTFALEIAEKIAACRLGPIDVSMLSDEPSPEQSLRNFREFVMEYQRQQQEAPRKFLPEVDAELCNSCGECYEVCPTGAISADFHGVDAAKCIKCCACVKTCPAGARSLFTPFARPLSENFNGRKSPVWIV